MKKHFGLFGALALILAIVTPINAENFKPISLFSVDE